jgi:hypothetical protein
MDFRRGLTNGEDKDVWYEDHLDTLGLSNYLGRYIR